jgi:hypothetical protein
MTSIFHVLMDVGGWIFSLYLLGYHGYDRSQYKDRQGDCPHLEQAQAQQIASGGTGTKSL